MEATVAEHVVRQLAEWEVPFVFGMIGESVGPLVAALGAQHRVHYVAVRQADAAGFMASAYAKLTGRLGVCLADGGPGCVRLLNGVYDAHFDRVPLLALTGQAETGQLGTRWPQVMAQDLVFQEAAAAYNHTLASAEQAPEVLYRAMRAAVVRHDVARLGLPRDLQERKVRSAPLPPPAHPGPAAGTPPAEALEEAVRRLRAAERPAILAGRGAVGALRPLFALAEALGAPVVHTLPALGQIPWDHELNAGVLGEFGTGAAARLFGQADVVLVVGTTWWQPRYAPDAFSIQIDADPDHLGMGLRADVPLVGDAAEVLQALAVELRAGPEPLARPRWREEVRQARADWEEELARRTRAGGRADAAVHPGLVVEALGRQLPEDTILCLDVGDNTYWISSGLRSRLATVLVSGHWRSTGFALPAANAACLVERLGGAVAGRPVVAVLGDGGLGEVLAEFTTAVQYRLPVLAVVFRNDVLAQEAHAQVRAGLRAHGTRVHNPDFAAFARICGGAGIRVERPAEVAEAIAQGLRSALAYGQPTLVDVPVARVMPEYPEAPAEAWARRPAELASR